MSAFWWGAFARRHQAIAVAEGAIRQQRTRERTVLARAARGKLEQRLSRWDAQRRRKRQAAEQERVERIEPRSTGNVWRQRLAGARGTQAEPATDPQTRRMLEFERAGAGIRARGTRSAEARLVAKRAQMERLLRERRMALAAGNARRATELAHRSRRVAAEISREQRGLAADRPPEESVRARTRRGKIERLERQVNERSRFLDAQARLPGSLRTAAGAAGPRRDYSRLASLVGLHAEDYNRLGPHEQRRTRLQIDRELALRTKLRAIAQDPAGRGDSQTAPRATRDSTAGPAALRAARGRVADAQHDRRPESSVMRDAREVAARRKRQLGINRP
jgi:hypothetical protein